MAEALAEARPAAAELPGDRRAQPRPAAHRRRRGAAAGAAPGRAAARARARCWSTCAPTSSSTTRTSPARSATRCCGPASARSSRGSPTASRRSSSSGRDDEDGRRAAALARRVGLRRLGGFLHGGMTSWRQERRPTARVERLAARRTLPARDGEVQILDVRERARVGRPATSPARRSRPGTTSTSCRRAGSRAPDRGRLRAPVSAPAPRASLLLRHGGRHVLHVVDGGVPAWGRLGHPLERSGDRPRRPPEPACPPAWRDPPPAAAEGVAAAPARARRSDRRAHGRARARPAGASPTPISRGCRPSRASTPPASRCSWRRRSPRRRTSRPVPVALTADPDLRRAERRRRAGQRTLRRARPAARPARRRRAARDRADARRRARLPPVAADADRLRPGRRAVHRRLAAADRARRRAAGRRRPRAAPRGRWCIPARGRSTAVAAQRARGRDHARRAPAAPARPRRARSRWSAPRRGAP